MTRVELGDLKARQRKSIYPAKESAMCVCVIPRIRAAGILSVAAGLVGLLGGCASTTLLNANFDADVVGHAPAQSQLVGTVSVDSIDDMAVIVVRSPLPDLPNTNWVKVGFPAVSPSALKGMLANSPGDGHYSFTSTMFVRGGTGTVTVQFEQGFESTTNNLRFLHVDLLGNGQARVEDKANFGSFPLDRPFILNVTLDVDASGAKAHVALAGDGASGSADLAIDPVALPVARRFGAVRLWLASGQPGEFFADNIVVAYRP